MFKAEGTARTKQRGVDQPRTLEEQKGEMRGEDTGVWVSASDSAPGSQSCVGVKVSELGRGQGMQSGLGFYSESSGKPLEGFKQETVKS